jgi:predicted CopG family antitoxin
MTATTIQVSEETRQMLATMKGGGQTYDEVIRGLIYVRAHPLTWEEIVRRASEPGHPVERLLRKSRALRHRAGLP